VVLDSAIPVPERTFWRKKKEILAGAGASADVGSQSWLRARLPAPQSILSPVGWTNPKNTGGKMRPPALRVHWGAAHTMGLRLYAQLSAAFHLDRARKQYVVFQVDVAM
jgi:hypothetical protein